MFTPELPSHTESWDDPEYFRDNLLNAQQAAAPGCDPDFCETKMRFADEDGSYYYFPHPRDMQQVLDFARILSRDSDVTQRSLILPVGILAAHPFRDGNGRTSRFVHATLSGKSPAEIAELEICGPRIWIGTDEEAHKVIDLRPPPALQSYIEDHVYETAGLKKQINLQHGYTISDEGVASYKKAQGHLPKDYVKDLDETITAVPFNDSYYFSVLEPAAVEFALNAQLRNDENFSEEVVGPTKALTSLGEVGLIRFVDDMWRFRLLRAKTTVACLANTVLGSRIITIPDHDEPLTVTSHYTRLTNNLVNAAC